MKINGEFILREIVGEQLLVPVGDTAMNFQGMIILSATGAVVWNCISRGESLEKAVEQILEEYDTDEETVRADVDELVKKLLDNGLISE